MSNLAIRVSNLSKDYKLGGLKRRHDTLRDHLTHGVKGFFSRNGRDSTLIPGLSTFDPQLPGSDSNSSEIVRALEDVSFDVEEGEVVGIIGRNGAGKSTLLKILSRITEPKSGRVEIYGRVGCLLEVGTGFHPELTGRENVYFNGAIIGMRKADVERKFDEIVAFAELEKFIDTPVKRYSSGMSVRLGFAVASSLDPDVLIVDEVLAVGDLAFQRKCFERMENLIKRQGKTVLLVSHNIRQMARICSRVILIDGGKIANDGEPSKVCNDYFSLSQKEAAEEKSRNRMTVNATRSSGEIEVEEISLYRAGAAQPTDDLELHEAMRIGVKFRANVNLIQPEIVVGFHTTDFIYIASTSSAALQERPDFGKGSHYFECKLSDMPLCPGIYSLRISFLDRNKRSMWAGTNVKSFRVFGDNWDITKMPALGVVDLPFCWEFFEPTGSPQLTDKTICSS